MPRFYKPVARGFYRRAGKTRPREGALIEPRRMAVVSISSPMWKRWAEKQAGRALSLQMLFMEGVSKLI